MIFSIPINIKLSEQQFYEFFNFCSEYKHLSSIKLDNMVCIPHNINKNKMMTNLKVNELGQQIF